MKYTTISGLERKGDYIHIGNNHIFLNLFTGSKEYLKDIHKFLEETGDMHQHIHIFVSVILDMDEFIQAIAINDPRAKTTIHVPRRRKDYKRMIEYYYRHYLEDNGYVFTEDDISSVSWMKVVVEKQGPSFNFTKGSFAEQLYHKLDVVYARDGIYINLPVVSCLYDPAYEIKYPHNRSSQAAIQSQIQRDNMDLFKDVIIKNFRKVCPSNILKTFKNSDEIWEFITQEGEWSFQDEVESRNAELARQIRDMSPEAIRQRGEKIARNSIYGASGQGSPKAITPEEAAKIREIQKNLGGPK